MKILHAITSFDPTTGGPPRIALRLAAGAAQRGHSVTMLFHDLPQFAGQILQERREVPGADLITYLPIAPLTRWEDLTGRRAGQEIDRIIGGFDFLHLHSIWNGMSRTAMAAARRRGVKYVMLANGMLDPWSMQQKRLKKRVALALSLRKLLNGAAFMHVGNEDEKAGVLALGLTAPIEIVPNGIYLEEFNPPPAPGQFLAAHPELAGKRFVLFLSRLHYKKGLDYLAAAFAKIAPRHPEVHLVVAGPDGGAEAAFQQDIAAAGLTDRTHLIGAMYGRERFNAVVDAACFCLPSRQEGFSIAILEALACGTPAVITTGCHFPEVGTAGAGIVTELDANEIAAALNRVLSDPTEARRMGAAGQALVRSRFTWDAVAEQMEAAYGRALGETRMPKPESRMLER